MEPQLTLEELQQRFEAFLEGQRAQEEGPGDQGRDSTLPRLFREFTQQELPALRKRVNQERQHGLRSLYRAASSLAPKSPSSGGAGLLLVVPEVGRGRSLSSFSQQQREEEMEEEQQLFRTFTEGQLARDPSLSAQELQQRFSEFAEAQEGGGARGAADGGGHPGGIRRARLVGHVH